MKNGTNTKADNWSMLASIKFQYKRLSKSKFLEANYIPVKLTNEYQAERGIYELSGYKCRNHR